MLNLRDYELRCAALLRKHLRLMEQLRLELRATTETNSTSVKKSVESLVELFRANDSADTERRFCTVHATVDPLSPLLDALFVWKEKLGPAALKFTDDKQRKELAGIAKQLAALLIFNAEYSSALLCLCYCVRLQPSDVDSRLLAIRWACHLSQWRLASELLRLCTSAGVPSSSILSDYFDALQTHCRLNLDCDSVNDDVVVHLVQKSGHYDGLKETWNTCRVQAVNRLALFEAGNLANMSIEKIGDPLKNLTIALGRYQKLVRSKLPDLQQKTESVCYVEAELADDNFVFVASDVAGLMETLWRCAVEFLNVGQSRKAEAYAQEGSLIAHRLGSLSWVIRFANLLLRLQTAVNDVEKRETARAVVNAILFNTKSQHVDQVPDHQCSCYICAISAKSSAIALEAACARLALVSVEKNSTDDSWDVLTMAKTAYMNALDTDVEIICGMLGIQRFSVTDLPSYLITSCVAPLISWSKYFALVGDWSHCRFWAEKGLLLAQCQPLKNRCELLIFGQMARECVPVVLKDSFDWIASANDETSRITEEFANVTIRRKKKSAAVKTAAGLDRNAALEEFNAFKHLFYKEWRSRICSTLAMTAVDKTEAAFLWTESMATTVRQQARETVGMNDEFVDVNHFKAICAQFPSDFTIVLLTVDERRVLRLIRLKGGKNAVAPLIVPLAVVSEPIEDNGRRTAFESLSSLFIERDASQKVNPAKKYWECLQKIDKKLQTLLARIEAKWLDCFAPLLLSEQSDVSALTGSKLASEALLNAGFSNEMSSLLQMAIPRLPEDKWLKLARRLAMMDGLPISAASNARIAWGLMRAGLTPGTVKSTSSSTLATTVLVLSAELASIPWECLPIFDTQPAVCRYSSLQLFARLLRKSTTVPRMVDGRSTYYVVNPDSRLDAIRRQFGDFFNKQKDWSGFDGNAPSAAEAKAALESNDIFLYCGHGNGGQHIGNTTVRDSDCKAVTVLMGCNSVSIDETAGFDSRRPVYEYSIAGCPCLVGCLWNVNGSEITGLFAALLAVWLKRDVPSIDNSDKGRVKPMEAVSHLLAAIAVARRQCKLPYLTGAAVVAYGLPIVSQAF